MPYKCSVKGCRSNYDSTSHEKVTVFSIPTDPDLRQAWIANLMLTSTKKSARVCIKHFDPFDIENQNKRNALKAGAVPTPDIHVHEPNQWLEGRVVVQEIQQEETIDEDLIESFEDICANISEIQETAQTDWSSYVTNDGICFYHLGQKDEDFSDVTITFKICISRRMKIRVFQHDVEASYEELGYSTLTKWSQLTEILVKYQHEPPIEVTREATVHLAKAIGALNLITNPELSEDLDIVKIHIENLCTQSEKLASDELYQDVIVEDYIVEDGQSLEDVKEEDYLDASMESLNETDYPQPFKCRHCSVQLVSAKGLRSHEMKCNFAGTTSTTSTTRVVDESMFCEELQDSIDVDKSSAERKKRTYRYPCTLCTTPERKRSFVTKLQAAQHLLDKHDIEIRNVKNFCFICSAEFDDYINHVRIHSCKYTCSFCGSKFLTESKLEHHMEVKHAGESEADRPFKCEEKDCGFFFKKVSHLKSHQLSHHFQMNSEEFKCEHCDKTFGRQLHLRVHARLHNHSFECNYLECTRVFKKLSSLKEHYLKEHGVSDIYMCNYDGCDDRFQMLVQLKQHREAKHSREPVNVPQYYDGHYTPSMDIVKDE